jgi:hypothetical protein
MLVYRIPSAKMRGIIVRRMGVIAMGRGNQRRRQRLFTRRPHRGVATAFADSFQREYRPFTIIPPASRPKRGTAPLVTAGVLIALGAALIFVFAR